MRTIKRKLKAFNDLKFTVNLEGTGKVPSDIDNIIFSIKNVETEADNVLFLKQLSAGASEMEKSSVDNLVTVLVKWPETEYSQFTVDTFYLAGLFFKFNGEPEANENNNGQFNIVILQDFLRL